MEKLVEYYETVGRKTWAARKCEKALALIAVMENGAYGAYVDLFNKKMEELK